MVEQIYQSNVFEELSNVIIRPISKADLPALEWDGEFKHFRNVYASAYDHMTKGTTIIWIAELPATGLLGQVFLQLISDRPELADGWQRAYLYAFRIKPLYRNHGLGSRMVNVVENYARVHQFSRITLNVARINLDAIRLYKRLGYQIVAQEPGIWSYPDDQGNWQTVHEPSWRMEKLISGSV